MSSPTATEEAAPRGLSIYDRWLLTRPKAEAEAKRLADVKASEEYELACHVALSMDKLEYEVLERQHGIEYEAPH